MLVYRLFERNTTLHSFQVLDLVSIVYSFDFGCYCKVIRNVDSQ